MDSVIQDYFRNLKNFDELTGECNCKKCDVRYKVVYMLDSPQDLCVECRWARLKENMCLTAQETVSGTSK